MFLFRRQFESSTMSGVNDDELLINTNQTAKSSSKMVLISRGNHSIFQYLKATLLKLQNFCSTCALIICLVLLILSLMAIVFKPLNKVVHVLVIDTDHPVQHVTNKMFLSVALDSSLIAAGFPNFNMTDPKLVKLMMPLAPGYLRIGGTMADRLWFMPGKYFTFKSTHVTEMDAGECANAQILCSDPNNRQNFTMSENEWLELNKLANSAGLTILFDLNSLIRFDTGSWNFRNAVNLIEFSDFHNLSVSWQLGNEPNAYRHVFNYEVNATQLASDYVTLRQVLNKYPRYKNSLLVGPDVTRPLAEHKESQIYLQEFLGKAGHLVDAITWHQYYFNGRTATSSEFLSPTIFDLLAEQIDVVKAIVKAVDVKNKPIWLGETSSAYGGGAPNYSDRYIATFIWLDKLGLSARSGLDLVVRQTLFKGHYALIDDELEPAPDWWVSVLYKTFVGPEVVPCYSMSSRKVRLYCHCTAKKALYSIIPSVTIFGLNMKNTEAKVRIQGLLPELEQQTTKVFAYVLTPYLSLLSKYIQLNDEVLYLLENGDLPPFKPNFVDAKPYLIMPPFSIVFWVVPSPTLKFCNSGIADV